MKSQLVSKLFTLLSGKTSQGLVTRLGENIIAKGTKFTLKGLQVVDFESLDLIKTKWSVDSDLNTNVKELLNNYILKNSEILGEHRRKKFAITVGDELPTGVLKLAKVYIAKKRKIQVGDKLAGRHGNKGIVAKLFVMRICHS